MVFRMNGQGSSILRRYPCPRPHRLAALTRTVLFHSASAPSSEAL